jgi:hypothetical protein
VVDKKGVYSIHNCQSINLERKKIENQRKYEQNLFIYTFKISQETNSKTNVRRRSLELIVSFNLKFQCFRWFSTGVATVPAVVSCRLLYLGVYFAAVTLCAAYSATLISSLAVKSYVLPFKNLQQLLTRGDYQMSVVNNSALLGEFEVSFRIFYVLFCSSYHEPGKLSSGDFRNHLFM